MILKFMTARNRNGNRQYLAIDTERKTYSTECRYMIPEFERVEIKAGDMRKIEARLDGFTREDFI